VEALRRRLSLLTWFALAGVLALALLPTVSHALAFASGASGNSAWAEVCTTQGLKRVAVGTGLPIEGGDAPAAPGPAPAAEHAAACPFCKLGADSPSLPTGPLAAPAAHLLRDLWQSPSCEQAPPDRRVWAAAQPRAPPPAG